MARTPDDPTKAQVWIDNTDPLNPLFEFYFPKGAKGDPGGIVNPSALGAGYDWNNLIVSGLYYAAGADMASMPNSPPSMAVGVNIMVTARNAAVVTQIAWTTSNAHNQIQFMRSLVSGTWGPWKVTRNTNIDNGAGKVLTTWDETANRSQLIFGDTGWRDISSLLANGWTATSLYLRRFNDKVTLKMYNVDGSLAAGNPSILNLPLGFRTPHGTSTFGVYTTGTGLSTVSVSNGGTVNAPGGVTRYGAAAFTELSYSTIDSWPSVLPGAAVGSIPNI
ncbi:hypothetical protein SEA_SUPPI_2 [Arthrobacter phage Suppi]|uniref:Minor tail protein n=2 Tax=Korravirus wayne TaxID=1982085 RepID=A0A1D8ESR4_9CAUD|nr:hypothetical protein SEA_SUPPI_2 [Arthrobacter phage Suppi]ASR83238.1 hypothetical protein SEA_CANOWICAKTE_2 [Arthrobacter phage Canowicakte]